MKVSSPAAHSPVVMLVQRPADSRHAARVVEGAGEGAGEASEFSGRQSGERRVLLDLASVYDRWFDHVCRWLGAFGIPASDREDLAQEVFLVVERQLATFDGQNLPGWLYAIARRTASDHRRRSWFKDLFRRRADFVWESAPDGRVGPDVVCEQRDAIRTVGKLLAKMDPSRREAFILFEIEGYSGDEIAAFEEIPVATVWTRLHYARKEFQSLAAASEGAT
jgi:RNA polymerase sigma-70 factor (ECF subfamily)